MQLANDLLAWAGLLALTGHPARRGYPKRMRLRLCTIPAVLARHVRTVTLRVKNTAPFADLVQTARQQLTTLAPP